MAKIFNSSIAINKKEALNKYIRSKIVDRKMHYVILDEIQLVDDFEFILNSFLYEKILMYMSLEVIRNSFHLTLLLNLEEEGIK